MRPDEIADKLRQARHPEDIFGEKADGVKDVYRDYAKLFHPDKTKGDKNAAESFKLLNNIKEWADKKVADGTYGNRRAIKPVVLMAKKNAYTLDRIAGEGDLCNVYFGINQDKEPILAKVSRVPSNNDLVRNEYAQLAWMRNESNAKGLKVMQHLPVALDSFELSDGKINRQVNILEPLPGFFSLERVKELYPGGIELAHAAWMFNRVLGALLATHQAGLVHGAVLPPHIMIQAETHNGVLIDWSYAQKLDTPIKATVPRYASFYPPELKSLKKAMLSLDTYMAAMCFNWIMGGDGQVIPASVPRPIQGIMRACWLGHHQRTSDVYEIFEDFGKALKAHFGPPKFRQFKMPVTK